MAGEDNNTIPLQNPYHPKTKEYLKNLQNEMQEAVTIMAEHFKILELSYAKLAREEKQAVEQSLIQKQRADNKYQQLLDDLKQSENNPNTTKSELEDKKEKIVEKIIELEDKQLELNKSILENEHAIKNLDKTIQDRKEASTQAMLDKIKADNVSAYDDKGNTISHDKFATMLKENQDERPKPSETFSKTDLLNHLNNLIHKDSASIDQVEKKMRLLDNIALLNKLGGGDVTPSQMIALVQMNKQMLNIFNKIERLDEKANANDLKQVINLVQDVHDKKDQLSKNNDTIKDLKQSLNNLDNKLQEMGAKNQSYYQTPKPKLPGDK